MSKDDEVEASRDAWVSAVPGRTLEVHLVVTAEARKWRVALIEKGNVVAVGTGRTWEVAFSDALDKAARSSQ